jgi:hypothetical protein
MEDRAKEKKARLITWYRYQAVFLRAAKAMKQLELFQYGGPNPNFQQQFLHSREDSRNASIKHKPIDPRRDSREYHHGLAIRIPALAGENQTIDSRNRDNLTTDRLQWERNDPRGESDPGRGYRWSDPE